MDATPFTVCMINRKGGCGKTGSCHQISGAFAHLGHRVLLVDLDPQSSLTKGFFGPEATEAIPEKRTVMALFDDAYDPDPAKLLVATPCERITILPGANNLDNFNTPKPTEAGPVQFAVRTFLREVEGQFDVIILDCPPNLHLCSWNALLAADFAVVPVQPEDFGAQGITHIQRTFDLALEKYNPRLRMLGYLVTLRQRLALHDAYERQLRDLYGDQVFKAVFASKKDYKEAIAEWKPIHAIKPKCAAAKEVRAIAEEMLSRVAEGRTRPPEFIHFENRAASQEFRKVAS